MSARRPRPDPAPAARKDRLPGRTMFWRILLLLVLAVLLTGLSTAGIFFLTSRAAFARLKTNEMIPRAVALAALVRQNQAGILDTPSFVRLVQADRSLWDAWLHIFDSRGELVAYTEVTGEDPGAPVREDLLRTIDPYLETVLQGGTLSVTVRPGTGSLRYLMVAVPVRGESGATGAVFLTKPLTEINAALGGLYRALFISLAIVMAALLGPAAYFSIRLSRPIRDMSRVALSMADGDFSVRAREDDRGESGQLGRALNYLSRRLSSSISALTTERNRLSQVLDGLAEGIVAIDDAGRVTHANPALRQLFGVGETVGIADRDRLIPDPSIWEDLDRMIADPTALMRILRSGDRVLRVTLSPLMSPAGHVEGAVGLFRDVTDTERLEQTRREYVANVSHELRTPVSSIRGLVETLQDGLLPTESDRVRYYGYIHRETLRLTRLIDDLLELSRLQSGAVALDIGPVDPLGPLAEGIAAMAQRAGEKGVRLESRLPGDGLPTVLANADRIEQVLVILLDNAVKFTPAGGAVTVDARVSDEEAAVIVEVRDTGPGIDPADLPHVFDRFFKADRARTAEGTGLGLSIARELLSRMGGDLSAESPGQGALFRFSLPCWQPGPASGDPPIQA